VPQTPAQGAKVAEEQNDRRRTRPAKGAIVADIGPDAAGDRLALCQDRRGRVVAEEPLGCKDANLDQRISSAAVQAPN
jgi:hypothetical protein